LELCKGNRVSVSRKCKNDFYRRNNLKHCTCKVISVTMAA
jgi:hypothetical protein